MRNLVMSIVVCSIVVACSRKTKTKTEYITKTEKVETVAFTEQEEAQWQAKVDKAEAETAVAEEKANNAEEALTKSQEELAIHKSLVDTRMRLRMEYFARTESDNFFTNSDAACSKLGNEEWALKLASKDVKHILELIDGVTEDESNLDIVAFLQDRINTATPEEERTTTWAETANNIWETELSAHKEEVKEINQDAFRDTLNTSFFDVHGHITTWKQATVDTVISSRNFHNSVKTKWIEAHERHAWKLYGKCL